ncbi:tRNA uridine-5-carboxymethylaminomethyl(34) synthesis GTPase MnmE [Candidatus Desantisbacteria bacterium CG07_land_8_20_14_0_80_39_15]|uniref:tRNA modification GTPase MnmE n=2 Tax=unclassified Candidatus Desantisiibacteriota TaxID=3106372 RepID=A0A2H9PCR9_9BACT|nr:MAG: tRNA uridine-5-carboxymethylaminomethyl(34) synthesis GTPase MnmE [Candidatus Desantisbacteria bacterium CG07_land_8_20_14_0_80_39_15]PIZ17100.1 MAG: tRNA uridine-5-carboxymethylaminomethyl(34) synthesis GTPase MnmE [Candidatus Desantisbacteria bacterium CG_4_10_14_0_8_um_filter_39_17]
MRKISNLQKSVIQNRDCFPPRLLVADKRGGRNDSHFSDTIAAISTPIGEGGIGIVRMSGSGSLKIADEIFHGGHFPKGSLRTKEKPSQFASYTTHYGYILNKGEKIDEVILTVMHAPKTYTREDVVEINCHGGIVPLKRVLELVIKKGVRLAQPGEFTKRAFLNGRIDLTQAEAVVDIVRAKTDLSLKVAMEQLQGGLSAAIKKVRGKLLNLLARMEASIDFPEEDIGDVSGDEIRMNIDSFKSELEELLLTFDKGKMLREGVTVAIIGRPNVGKSSLMNCLLGEERAIVTSIPGTTTDTIEETINIKGAQMRIVDTAGISSKVSNRRKRSRNIIEIESIKRAKEVLSKSELVLLIIDGSQSLKTEDRDLLKEIKGKKTIVLINKIDLPQKVKPEDLKKFFKVNIIEISAKEKINIDNVQSAIGNMIWDGEIDFTGDAILTNIRHKELVSVALESLNSAARIGVNSPELVTLDLRESIASLGEITGETITEEVLDRIFENFCIGK